MGTPALLFGLNGLQTFQPTSRVGVLISGESLNLLVPFSLKQGEASHNGKQDHREEASHFPLSWPHCQEKGRWEQWRRGFPSPPLLAT